MPFVLWKIAAVVLFGAWMEQLDRPWRGMGCLTAPRIDG